MWAASDTCGKLSAMLRNSRTVMACQAANCAALTRREPKQAPRPEAEACCDDADPGLQDEPGVRREARPFRDDAPQMHQGEEGEERTGGHEISLHGSAPGLRRRCKGVTAASRIALKLWATRRPAQGRERETVRNRACLPALRSGAHRTD